MKLTIFLDSITQILYQGKKKMPSFRNLFFIALVILLGSTRLQAPQPLQGFPTISDEEIQNLYKYLENLDEKELEELEMLTKKTLSDMGYDPETLQPLGKKPEIEEKAPLPAALEKPTIEEKKEPAPPQDVVKDIARLFDPLIKGLTSIRTATSYNTIPDKYINRWLPDINALISNLPLINKPQHHARLAAPEFSRLRTALERLYNTVRMFEPLLNTPLEKPVLWEDPYEVLGLFPTATQEQIEDAYQKSKEFNDPATLRDRLSDTGASQAEIEKALKEAQINFDFITDAYHKIKDPQSRSIIDNELQALQAAEQATNRSSEQTRQSFANALSTSIYQDQILNNLEDFLKKYEPVELEQRKKMEQAEAERIKELKAAQAAKPYGKTIVVKSEKDIRPWRMPELPTAGPVSIRTPSAPIAKAPEKPKPAAKEPFKPLSKLPEGKKPQKKDKKEGDKKEDKEEEEKKEEQKEKVAKKPAAKEEKKEEKKKDEKKKEEELPDRLAFRLLDLEQQLTNFNDNFDAPFFKAIKDKPLSVEQLSPNLANFHQASRLGDLGQKLTSIQKELSKADTKKHESYKKLWKDVTKTANTFEKNLLLINQVLQMYTPENVSPSERAALAGGSGKIIQEIRDILRPALKAFQEIQKTIGEKPKAGPEKAKEKAEKKSKDTN